jgi:photosystem II stability/assembly factor-like uncharacterized protein
MVIHTSFRVQRKGNQQLRMRSWTYACTALIFSLTIYSSSVFAAFPDRAERPAVEFDTKRRSIMVDIAQVGERILTSGERGRIFYSDDQGASWAQAQVPVSVMITAIDVATKSTLWAVGHDGIVLNSTDRGASWSKVLAGAQINQLVVEYYQGLVAKAKADIGFPKEELEELLFRADDAIITLEDNRLATLLDVKFIDGNVGYILGSYGLLLQTLDGGKSWQPLIEALGNLDGFHLNAMIQTDNSLLIAGEGGSLFRSVDQGASWESLESPYNGSFFGVQSLGEQHLIVYGLRGNAFESQDGGDSWLQLQLPIKRTLAGSTLLNDGTVVLVGSFGAMMVRPAGQKQFNVAKLSIPAPSVAVAPLAGEKVLVVGLTGAQIVSVPSYSSTAIKGD